MTRGFISRLVPSEGYGFVVEDGEPFEMEFHWTAFTAGRIDQIQVGHRVEFDKQTDHRQDGRVRAINIRLAQYARCNDMETIVRAMPSQFAQLASRAWRLARTRYGAGRVVVPTV